MCRKLISILMSFLLLFKLDTVNVFAKGDRDFDTVEGRNKENPKYVDYCREVPKNMYDKTEDVDCAVENVFQRFKLDAKKLSLSLTQLGKTGEIDVHMWKYNGLTGLASDFEGWIKNAEKNLLRASL